MTGIHTVVELLLIYRISRWVFQLSTVQRLSTLQRNVISIVLRLPPYPEETEETFLRGQGRAKGRSETESQATVDFGCDLG